MNWSSERKVINLHHSFSRFLSEVLPFVIHIELLANACHKVSRYAYIEICNFISHNLLGNMHMY